MLTSFTGAVIGQDHRVSARPCYNTNAVCKQPATNVKHLKPKASSSEEEIDTLPRTVQEAISQANNLVKTTDPGYNGSDDLDYAIANGCEVDQENLQQELLKRLQRNQQESALKNGKIRKIPYGQEHKLANNRRQCTGPK